MNCTSGTWVCHTVCTRGIHMNCTSGTLVCHTVCTPGVHMNCTSGTWVCHTVCTPGIHMNCTSGTWVCHTVCTPGVHMNCTSGTWVCHTVCTPGTHMYTQHMGMSYCVYAWHSHVHLAHGYVIPCVHLAFIVHPAHGYVVPYIHLAHTCTPSTWVCRTVSTPGTHMHTQHMGVSYRVYTWHSHELYIQHVGMSYHIYTWYSHVHLVYGYAITYVHLAPTGTPGTWVCYNMCTPGTYWSFTLHYTWHMLVLVLQLFGDLACQPLFSVLLSRSVYVRPQFSSRVLDGNVSDSTQWTAVTVCDITYCCPVFDNTLYLSDSVWHYANIDWCRGQRPEGNITQLRGRIFQCWSRLKVNICFVISCKNSNKWRHSLWMQHRMYVWSA